LKLGVPTHDPAPDQLLLFQFGWVPNHGVLGTPNHAGFVKPGCAPTGPLKAAGLNVEPCDQGDAENGPELFQVLEFDPPGNDPKLGEKPGQFEPTGLKLDPYQGLGWWLLLGNGQPNEPVNGAGLVNIMVKLLVNRIISDRPGWRNLIPSGADLKNRRWAARSDGGAADETE